MAEVDFTNAVIEVNSSDSVPPFAKAFLNLDGGYLYSSSGNIVGSGTVQTVKNEKEELVFQYQGSFTANGTEFYMVGSEWNGRWRVHGITFNNGDTYDFRVRADLIGS